MTDEEVEVVALELARFEPGSDACVLAMYFSRSTPIDDVLAFSEFQGFPTPDDFRARARAAITALDAYREEKV